MHNIMTICLILFVSTFYMIHLTRPPSSTAQIGHPDWSAASLCDILASVLFLDQNNNVCPGLTLHLINHIVMMSLMCDLEKHLLLSTQEKIQKKGVVMVGVSVGG